MNTNDFSVAKVGDSCWSDVTGEGKIISIEPTHSFPIGVKGITGLTSFTFKGAFYKDGPQCLFWSKPEFTIPTRPKRMVKKVVSVRPYLISDRLDTFGILVNASNASDVRWCGPEQDVEILVEE